MKTYLTFERAVALIYLTSNKFFFKRRSTWSCKFLNFISENSFDDEIIGVKLSTFFDMWRNWKTKEIENIGNCEIFGKIYRFLVTFVHLIVSRWIKNIQQLLLFLHCFIQIKIWMPEN